MPNSKILITVFVGLLVFSTFLTASAYAGDFWSDIIESIQEWFRISPFSGIFESPKKEVSYVSIEFYPTNYTITPSGEFGIQSTYFTVSGFKGTADFDPSRGVALLSHAGDDMEITCHLSDNITLTDLKITHFTLQNIRLEIIRGNWTETTIDGSADFADFIGKAELFPDHIILSGNVSKITKN